MFCKKLILVVVLILWSGGGWAAMISGIVVDDGGRPVSNAQVCIQGRSCPCRTDFHGRFLLPECSPGDALVITAGKFGFFNGGQPLIPEGGTHRIVLKKIVAEDHKGYQWLSSLIIKGDAVSPGSDEGKPCETCHAEVVEQWRLDAHSEAAVNPVFLSFFNGTDRYGETRAGPGYRCDFPRSNGNCATCHIPAQALESSLHVDPNKAAGVARQGIFCDFCHKVAAVEIDETGAKPGILSIEFHRPEKGHQVFYGPYPDVFPGEDGYHPLYSKSHYCAPCHHGKFWDVLAYSEFQEWKESSYREKNIHCQDCHMPADTPMVRFVPEAKGGILRDPLTIPSHVNLGVQDEPFMKEAIEMRSRAAVAKGSINLNVQVKNIKAGHHYPTGNPMRNMILLVDVKDKEGRDLKMVAGQRVPAWGGVGDPRKGNYAGMPGKGFAKVLKDAAGYPDRRNPHFSREFPAPHWRPCIVASDNRIPADGADCSEYRFEAPKGGAWPVQIKVTLFFRRGYKPWMDAKGFDFPDMEIASNQIIMDR